MEEKKELFNINIDIPIVVSPVAMHNTYTEIKKIIIEL